MAELTFYFDRNFGRRLPEALRKASPPFEIACHHDPEFGFAPDAKDDEWLAEVGKRGWIVFSHDRKFHKIEVEKAAIVKHAIGCFYVAGANQTVWSKLCLFVRAHEDIVARATTSPRPFVWHITSAGRFQQVIPSARKADSSGLSGAWYARRVGGRRRAKQDSNTSRR